MARLNARLTTIEAKQRVKIGGRFAGMAAKRTPGLDGRSGKSLPGKSDLRHLSGVSHDPDM